MAEKTYRPADVADVINALLDAGLIERPTCAPFGSRAAILSLTPSGAALLEAYGDESAQHRRAALSLYRVPTLWVEEDASPSPGVPNAAEVAGA